MRLLLKPTIANLQNEYGDNEFTDEDQLEEELLFRQGYESEVMEIEDGEEFEIPKGMCACVIEYEKSNENEYENEAEACKL